MLPSSVNRNSWQRGPMEAIGRECGMRLGDSAFRNHLVIEEE